MIELVKVIPPSVPNALSSARASRPYSRLAGREYLTNPVDFFAQRRVIGASRHHGLIGILANGPLRFTTLPSTNVRFDVMRRNV